MATRMTQAVALYDECNERSYASRETNVPMHILRALYREAHALLCSKEVEYLRRKFEENRICSLRYANLLREYIIETDRLEDYV
jgi:hypothetical protein